VVLKAEPSSQEDSLAAFNVHISAGLTASGVAATAVMVVGQASAQQMVLYFLLGTVGSLLPDVDSKSSTPVHVTFALLSTLLAFVAMFYAARSFDTVAELLLVWLATYLAFRWLVFLLFNRLTQHRGLFHSLPAAALATVSTAALSHHLLALPAREAWLSGCFVGLGYLLHLLLDELHSLNPFGMRQRRSLGTALKVYRKGHAMANATLYLAILGTLAWTPKLAPFVETMADAEVIREMQRRFVPAGTWFDARIGQETPADGLERTSPPGRPNQAADG
jgi:hypothetical protein